MEHLEKLYEGKAKILYNTSDPDLLVQYFKDDASAFDGKKKGTIVDKGVMNNHMSSKIFQYLEGEGIKTHFVKNLNDREMLVKKLDIIPVEVVLRNIAAGSLCKRLGIEEGRVMENPILEFFL
jgi:phosphoribosylaminoimidazole-succinocarboxamide synthase